MAQQPNKPAPIRPAGKRVNPIGNPLGWSQADVYNRADISEGDKLESLTFWERHAPRPLRHLLKARRAGK